MLIRESASYRLDPKEGRVDASELIVRSAGARWAACFLSWSHFASREAVVQMRDRASHLLPLRSENSALLPKN